MGFGNRLNRIRRKRNMTLLELAEMIDKTEATVQRYESGFIKNVKSDIIEDIAIALNVSPAFLMGWLDDDPMISAYEYDYFSNSNDSSELIENSKIKVPNVILGKYAGWANIYITKVKSESMDKLIPKHSIIAVRKLKLEKVKNNDLLLCSDDLENNFISRFFDDPSNQRYIFSCESNNMKVADRIVDYENIENVISIHGKIVSYTVVPD